MAEIELLSQAMKQETDMQIGTMDIGIAIRDALDGCSIDLHDENGKGDGLTHGVIQWIDAEDPNNLVVHCDNGQAFTVRVIAGEK